MADKNVQLKSSAGDNIFPKTKAALIDDLVPNPEGGDPSTATTLNTIQIGDTLYKGLAGEQLEVLEKIADKIDVVGGDLTLHDLRHGVVIDSGDNQYYYPRIEFTEINWGGVHTTFMEMYGVNHSGLFLSVNYQNVGINVGNLKGNYYTPLTLKYSSVYNIEVGDGVIVKAADENTWVTTQCSYSSINISNSFGSSIYWGSNKFNLTLNENVQLQLASWSNPTSSHKIIGLGCQDSALYSRPIIGLDRVEHAIFIGQADEKDQYSTTYFVPADKLKEYGFETSPAGSANLRCRKYGALVPKLQICDSIVADLTLTAELGTSVSGQINLTRSDEDTSDLEFTGVLLMGSTLVGSCYLKGTGEGTFVLYYQNPTGVDMTATTYTANLTKLKR